MTSSKVTLQDQIPSKIRSNQMKDLIPRGSPLNKMINQKLEMEKILWKKKKYLYGLILRDIIRIERFNKKICLLKIQRHLTSILFIDNLIFIYS